MTSITYALQVLLNLFFVPFILRLIGPRRALILGDCLYIVYVIVNMFSSKFTLFFFFLFVSLLICSFVCLLAHFVQKAGI